MDETGRITAIENGIATVCFVRTEACAKCRACELSRKDMYLQIAAPQTARVGDGLQIDIGGGAVVQASFLAYGIPLITLLAGIAAGYLLFPENSREVAAALLGLGAMTLGFLFLFLTEKRRRESQKYAPRIVAVIPREEMPPVPSGGCEKTE